MRDRLTVYLLSDVTPLTPFPRVTYSSSPRPRAGPASPPAQQPAALGEPLRRPAGERSCDWTCPLLFLSPLRPCSPPPLSWCCCGCRGRCCPLEASQRPPPPTPSAFGWSCGSIDGAGALLPSFHWAYCPELGLSRPYRPQAMELGLHLGPLGLWWLRLTLPLQLLGLRYPRALWHGFCSGGGCRAVATTSRAGPVPRGREASRFPETSQR